MEGKTAAAALEALVTHPPVAEGVVLVDFDGTLYPWGQMFDAPEPIDGSGAAVRLLKELGFTIGIFTSRLSPFWHESEGRDPETAIKAHLSYIEYVCNRDNIPFDFITAEKVPAVAYFDDKAYRVTTGAPLIDVVFLFTLMEGHTIAAEHEVKQWFSERHTRDGG